MSKIPKRRMSENSWGVKVIERLFFPEFYLDVNNVKSTIRDFFVDTQKRRRNIFHCEIWLWFRWLKKKGWDNNRFWFLSSHHGWPYVFASKVCQLASLRDLITIWAVKSPGAAKPKSKDPLKKGSSFCL